MLSFVVDKHEGRMLLLYIKLSLSISVNREACLASASDRESGADFPSETLNQ